MKPHYNIGFLLIDEYSSFNASFGLASILKERGHRVFFIVTAGTVFPKYVNDNGFETSIMEVPTFDRPKNNRFLQPWTRLKNHSLRLELEQNCLADLIKRKALDLVFLDNLYSYPFAVVLAELQVPTILLFPNFGSRMNSNYPPVFSSMIPYSRKLPKIRHKFIYALLWYWTISTRGRAYSFDCFEFVKVALKKKLLRIYNIGFERNLRQLGWTSTWSEWKRRPLIPEIVFGHRMLDWPAIASNPERCYFGATDIFRGISGFDWRGIDPWRPLIYSNISMSGEFEIIRDSVPTDRHWNLRLSRKEFRLAKRFIEVIIDAFSGRQDWQLIFACGPYFHIFNSVSLPPNVHLFERVPQLAVLARIDLAITWGGAGTIRECINFGVPMLVFPVWTDHFGNAARISFYNLGIRGNVQNVTSQKITDMIETALEDKKIRYSMEKMKEKRDIGKEIQDVVDFVSRHTSLEI